MTGQAQRRLAAILAADVVGYSKLMGEDEAGTLTALRELRRDLLAPALQEHRGNLVKSMGDGWLVEFASAGDGVNCAIKVQDALVGHEVIKLRMGLHIGDVTFDEEDIYGDGVNIASRLQEICDPGAIIISDIARRSIDGKLVGAFSDLGAQTLKNIAEPVIAYGRGMTVVTVSRALPLPNEPSIAVLPFDNMSGDREQEYFADGICEDIVVELSKVPWLFVIARNSSFTYKDADVSVKQIANDLGVQYVLEGSVRRSSDRVRVSVQLTDGTSGRNIWAERYDGELNDIFALQDRITDQIVGRTNTEVRAHETERARRQPPNNFRAWDRYLQGLWHCNRTNTSDNELAMIHFHKAIEIDPTFALPYAGVALCSHMNLLHDLADERDEWLTKGLEAANKAVSLDDRDGFVHFTLGRLLVISGQGDNAIAALARAVELNPSFASAYYGFGMALCWYGRPEQAKQNLDTAMRLSPRDPLLWGIQVWRASACNFLEEYENAEKWGRKAISGGTSNFWANIVVAIALAGQGRMAEANKEVSVIMRLKPEMSASLYRRLTPHQEPKYFDRTIELLRRAGLPE